MLLPAFPSQLSIAANLLVCCLSLQPVCEPQKGLLWTLA